MHDDESTVRIDKWLWAARFFKTRALAKTAVETGKVLWEGNKTKPSKQMEIGVEITIKRNEYTWVVKVKKLSQRRGPATQALTLYEETAESIAQREAVRLERSQNKAIGFSPAKRPSKRDRRLIKRFKDASLNDQSFD